MTPSFDPTDLAFLANPYPTYRRLREESPIFFFEKWGAYVLTRYDDVNTLLRDRRLGRVLENHPRWGEYEWQFEQTRLGSILELEPPDHTRIKEVFHQTFTPKRVRELSGKIHALCERLVDELLKRPSRQADLIHDFAQPIPVTVIADLLGIPEADRHHLVPWSKGIIGWFEPERTKAMEAEAIRCAQEFAAYLRAMIPLKRQQPGDDLFSAMLQVHDREPERLSEQELVNNCILLLNAGHEAVVNVMGNGMKALLSHPEAYARLKADPSLIPSAVEEMMRYDTPLQFFERYVLEPLEYKGWRWERGTKLVLYYASANHDPAVFADPEAFDITRNPNPHLAFGAGLHYCIGAPLARVELQTALRVLLERLPELRLLPQEFKYQPKNVFRYLEGLKVAY
ncbi:cytochrome P450 [Calidithermus timidus]|jgi:cytochrome P450|uniref:cytochrome P450 n=1 Tax=Calidithermus timidus TaxID=307124 RepID=UPI000372CF56|nr:cytochrome P450 [Calidithermus timidus]